MIGWEAATGGSILALLIGVGVAFLRRQMASASVAGAGADHAKLNVQAADKLYQRYQSEIENLQRRLDEAHEKFSRIDELQDRLTEVESELSRVRELHRQAQASDSKSRAALASLLQASVKLLAVAREANVSPDDLAELDRVIMDIMLEIAKS